MNNIVQYSIGSLLVHHNLWGRLSMVAVHWNTT